MSAIGADLPPHLLAKRKRQQEEESSSAPITAPGARRSPSPDSPDKRRRIIGPAMPPACLVKRPEAHAVVANDDSSDEDDDFGPALPTGGAVTQVIDGDEEHGFENSNMEPPKDKLRRDDWMTMPPKQDDLAARLDPTKQRPTKFNSAKGARGPTANDNSTWHETPKQKQKRLEDEMMGIGKPATIVKSDPERSSKKAKDEAAHRKIQLHNESRGLSLVEQHRQSKVEAELEDDPSKRGFDHEKDMASGSRFSSSQKREMLSKAAGFSDKFSGGTYL